MSIEPIFTAPPVVEMEDRLVRVRAAMEQQGLTHYVATCPDNVFYLTNFSNYVHERPFIVVVSLDGPLRFVVPKLEIPHVRMRAIGEIELVEYFEFPAPRGENWFDRFAAIFPQQASVGVESICPLQVYEAVPTDPLRHDVIDNVRQVKSEYEIGRIAYACGLASEAMKSVLEIARPNTSLRDVNSKANGTIMMSLLMDNPNTNMYATKVGALFQPPSVSFDPHNFTDVSVKMEEGGPHVALINGILNGYGMEVERTFFLGSVPNEAKKPYEIMMEARARAFELSVPGNVMGEVDAACNAIFKKAGYEDFLLHRTGHSIGVTGHEGPFLAEGYERVIEPGMFFTIEPGCYLPGVGGFRHSDTVLVTETGNESLTPLPDSLEDMTLNCN